MNNTEQMAAVAEEFSINIESNTFQRDEGTYCAMLQEIVDLRNVIIVKDSLITRLYQEKWSLEGQIDG